MGRLLSPIRKPKRIYTVREASTSVSTIVEEASAAPASEC
jgi:hypothetical protein